MFKTLWTSCESPVYKIKKVFLFPLSYTAYSHYFSYIYHVVRSFIHILQKSYLTPAGFESAQIGGKAVEKSFFSINRRFFLFQKHPQSLFFHHDTQAVVDNPCFGLWTAVHHLAFPQMRGVYALLYPQFVHNGFRFEFNKLGVL